MTKPTKCFCGCAGRFASYLVDNPEDRFSRDETHLEWWNTSVTDTWAATWQNQQNECAPSEVSDQPWHPPNLIRVFAVLLKKTWVLSYPLSAQRRLWSDWADAQADLSLRWAHTHFVGFAMSRVISIKTLIRLGQYIVEGYLMQLLRVLTSIRIFLITDRINLTHSCLVDPSILINPYPYP